MEGTHLIAITKEEILNEDVSKIEVLINEAASDRDRNKLLEMISSWDVYFDGYEPEEVSDSAEIFNWIQKSIFAGIPWFYFMSTSPDALGITAFLFNYGNNSATFYDGIIDFIKRNQSNLEDFIKNHDIPQNVENEIKKQVIARIQDELQS